MPKYIVVRRFDAWQNYEKEIEADTPQEALEQAKTTLEAWTRGDVAEFDDHVEEVFDENWNLVMDDAGNMLDVDGNIVTTEGNDTHEGE